MESLKKAWLPIVLVFFWISLTLFLRNEILLKHYWTSHYEALGLVFPSKPINGVVWMLWSLSFSIVIYLHALKFDWVGAALMSWFTGFVLMEVVVGNLGVLPMGILVFAIPMSLLEVFVASLIAKKWMKG